MTQLRFSPIGAITALLAALAAVAGHPGVAAAQPEPRNIGITPPEAAGVLNWVAYDDKHHVYLQVWEANREVLGRFVDANGNKVGATFIAATRKQSFAGVPRVAYSRGNAGVDVFLVTYSSDFNRFDRGSNIFGQLVRFTTTGSPLVGGVISISPNSGDGNISQKSSDIAYNPVTKKFLVAYSEPGNRTDVMVRHVLPDGSVPAGPVNVSNGAGDQGAASLSFDWERNRYFVTYSGDDPRFAPDSGHFGSFAHVLDGASGAPTSQMIVLAEGFAYESTSTFLPERDGFLALWTAFNPDADVMGRFVPSSQTASTLTDPPYGVMATRGLGEGWTTVSYDYVSRKVLPVTMRAPKHIGAARLDASGSPETAAFYVSTQPASEGSFYPVVRAAESGRLGISYITDYQLIILERVEFTTSPSPGPRFEEGACTTCPVPGELILQIDTPQSGATLNSPFEVAGWALDSRAASGAGVSTVHIWAHSHADPSQAIFVAQTPVGAPRPDVGAAYGARYTNSGWGAGVGNIPPGMYTLRFYPHSQFLNGFDFSKVKEKVVNIQGNALTKIDSPGWGNTFTGGGVGITITGWAIDLGNPSGTGIEAIDIWAIDAFTGQATFLGRPTMGLSSQEAANVGGSFRFLNAGYSFTNAVALPPSTYYLTVYARSVGAGTFNTARQVGVIVLN